MAVEKHKKTQTGGHRVALRTGMTRELGIVFLHHNTNAGARANLESLKHQNPDAVIATVSAGQRFSTGYSLDATPSLKMLHQANPARSSDWLVCSWFLQRRERCAKWWIVEWDTFARISASEYYRSVWQWPFVASTVRLPYREPEWCWFSHVTQLPQPLRAFATGAVPFLYLLSEAAIRGTCDVLLANRTTVGNGELRFATAAKKAGFAPGGFSPPNDKITWIGWDKVSQQRTIFHPVKNSTRAVRR